MASPTVVGALRQFLPDFLQAAPHGGDHLRRIGVMLAKDGTLAEAVRDVLAGRPCPTQESFYRLRSAGVLAGDSAQRARPRCQLYATFLSQHLL